MAKKAKAKARTSNLPSKHHPDNKKKRKKRIRPRKGIRTEEHKILDGEVTLYRTPPSGNIYQFQMWISKESKYIRKSTRKENLEDAKEVARELWKQTIAKIEMSQPIFALTTSQLVDLFLEKQKKNVGINKTYGRWVTIRSQLTHYLDFVGTNVKITDVDRNIWDGYYRFRRNKAPDVTEMTLQNEKSTIRSLYRFAIRYEYAPPRYLPEFPPLPKVEAKKRRALEVEEWRIIYEHMRSKEWSNVADDKVSEQRKFIYWATLVLANTGIRFGEMRRLKWHNIKRILKRDGETEVHINLDKTQTKNGISRMVVGRRGDVFNTIKRHSRHTKPKDYIFVDNNSELGNQISRYVYYRHWDTMLEETGLQEASVENISFYNLRHFYATQRLYSGSEPYALAKSLGCTLHYLWHHYGQTNTEMMGKNLTKKVKLDKDGQVIL